MTLTIYILIAIPICILTILIWAYFDYQKYKREHHLIILLSFLFPTLSHAQYVDNEKCCISFKTYENAGGNLAASNIRNLECPSYEVYLIDYGCGKFNKKVHIME